MITPSGLSPNLFCELGQNALQGGPQNCCNNANDLWFEVVSFAMKIVLNCTPIVIGGGIQVAAEICNQLATDNRHEWTAAVSLQVESALKDRTIKLNNSRTFSASPARSRKIRRELKSFVNSIQPDVIFTVFGPAYVKFDQPHLCGVADGWVTHAGRTAYASLKSPIKMMRTFALTVRKGLEYRRAERWVVEAAAAKKGLSQRFWIDSERISVVSNNCASHYWSQNVNVKPLAGCVRILTFASAYRHKNLGIIPFVANSLQNLRPDFDFKFVITAPSDSPVIRDLVRESRKLKVEHRIENLGYVPLSDGPSLYRSCHLCFMPSLLETFSATYPEAMAMKLPIVTTDLDFAREICRDSALYFPPRSADCAASKILQLYDSPDLVQQLTDSGSVRLLDFPEPRQKFESYVSLLEKMFNEYSSA